MRTKRPISLKTNSISLQFQISFIHTFNLVSRAFPIANRRGVPPIFWGKSLGTRLYIHCILYTTKHHFFVSFLLLPICSAVHPIISRAKTSANNNSNLRNLCAWNGRHHFGAIFSDATSLVIFTNHKTWKNKSQVPKLSSKNDRRHCYVKWL